ncbi:MAG: putative DNA-binding domain-containing protein [Cellvibrionaceae bacterium]|nr:putative DNA-binding domain-containing protein [Cellvibrionaceae bacterium]
MTKDITSPPSQLLNFQEHYSHHLRAPAEVALDEHIPPRRSRVYKELLFNNLCGFLDRCFPVTRSLLDESSWRQLNRAFYRDWRCQTPYFSRIPWEFVQYVSSKPNPDAGDWFGELLDYEWRELEAEIHKSTVVHTPYPINEGAVLQVNPTLQNLQYQWPVHQISNSFIPAEPTPTFLLVYRRFDHQVQFMEINALTSVLLQILQQKPATTDALFESLAELMEGNNQQALRDSGKPLLQDLVEKNAVIIKNN